jgi:futalosine hydrolase
MNPPAATPTPGGLLIVAATALELDGLKAELSAAAPWRNAWSEGVSGSLRGLPCTLLPLGVGTARSAAGWALAIEQLQPSAAILIGIGGAYVGSFLSIGMAMWADEDIELDLGVASDAPWAEAANFAVPLLAQGPGSRREAATHPGLTAALARASSLPRGRFATLDAISHSFDRANALQQQFDVSIESMEGAAVAMVAAQCSVPLAQLRAVSNLAGERDHARWNLRGALRAAHQGLLDGLDALHFDMERKCLNWDIGT